MQKKYFKYLLIALIFVFIVPQIALASWWNPFSWNWNIWSYFFHSQNQVVTTAKCVPEGGIIGAPQSPEDLCCEGLIKQATSTDGSGTGSGTVGKCIKPTNQTADWKTYTNSQYGFEFKYPSEFGNTQIFPKSVLDCNSQAYDEIGLVSFKNISINIACPNDVKNSPSSKGNKTAITIAGRQAYIFEYTSAVGYTNKEAYIPLSSGNYLVIGHTYKVGRPADYLELSQAQWQNILSNFKFTTPTDQTAGWQTYTNKDWGIEFKYPSNFGNLNIDSTNLLSFKDKINENKTNIRFLKKTTLEDIKKCGQDCQQCQKDGTCQICAPCITSDYWQKQKDFIENNNVGKVECLGYKCQNCEITKIGDIKMLVEHSCFNPGGDTDHKVFYENNTLFEFLPNEEYVGNFFAKYSTDEKTILSTFKFIISINQTGSWKTFKNAKYGFEVRYPISGWKAENLASACLKNVCNPDDYIADGIKISSLALFDPLSNPDDINIGTYGSGFDYWNNKCLKNKINIGDRTYCRTVGFSGLSGVDYSGYSDFISYINFIVKKSGDKLTGKIELGPYFNDGYWIKYDELNSKNPKQVLSADIMEYQLGFEINIALTEYYKKNNTLPPMINEITPNTWCYNVFTKYKPLVDTQESLARLIFSTFKFTN